MHWFEHLASLYTERDIPLYHMTVLTDIEIKLDMNGAFIGAVAERLPTVIPVTESSMTRTSSIAPHPLSDRLRYLEKGLSEPHHSAYLMQLTEWADSEHSTQRLCAVRRYIEAGTLSADISHLSANDASFIRFTVGGTRLWEDKELFSAHIRRTCEAQCDFGLCCISGEQTMLARSHPQQILSAAYTAKLICSENRHQIKSRHGGHATGREISFKAHTVLRRMISEGGICMGNRSFAAWDDTGNAVALPLTESATDFSAAGNVTVIGLAAATKGRISVTFLRRIASELYSERCRRWQDLDISARTAADISFGRRHRSGLICTDGVYGQTAERLLCCILDDMPLPSDILHAAEKRSPEIADKLHHYNGGVR